MNRATWLAGLTVFGAALSLPATAQTVKVTPLGGIEGEFCPQDPLKSAPSAARFGRAARRKLS